MTMQQPLQGARGEAGRHASRSERAHSHRWKPLLAVSLVPTTFLLLLLSPLWLSSGADVTAYERLQIFAATLLFGWVPTAFAAFVLAWPSLVALSLLGQVRLRTVLALGAVLGFCVLNLCIMLQEVTMWPPSGWYEDRSNYGWIGLVGAAIGLFCAFIYWTLGGKRIERGE